MGHRAGRTRQARRVVWLIVGAVVLALVGTPVWIHQANNAAARQLEAQLLELPLPADTALVDSAWAAERLAPAGNGMQVAGALLVRSALSLEQLREFYGDRPESPGVRAWDSQQLGRESLLFAQDHDLDRPGLFMITDIDEVPPNTLLGMDVRGH